MNNNDVRIEEQILELLNENKYIQVRNLLIELKEIDIAEILEQVAKEIDAETMLLLFRMLPKDIATDVFAEISNEQQQMIVETISDKEINQIINELYLDDAVDFLEEMPPELVDRVLKIASSTKRKQINQIFNYPEDSAGSLMTTEYLELKGTMTVKEAIENIRKVGILKKTINTCYVTDSKKELEGTISIRKIVISEENVKIKDIMKTTIVSVNTNQDQEEVVDLFKKYDINTIAVVDNQNMLVGIITVDNVIDVIEEETTEDIEKMNAIAPSEEEYLKENILVLAKNRIIWLIVLMISAMISGSIMRKYDEILSSTIVLSAFLPMLMGTCGNAGSQSSVLIIRGLAIGEIEMKDILKIMWKELRIGLIIGIILAIINFARIEIFDTVGYQIAFVVSISLFFTLVLANIMGGILPIIAKKMKLDPALMASPLVTTIVDATSLLIYFNVAQKILKI